MLQLSELRVHLDQLTDRIVSRLKDRSRFPLNEVVYQPDAVPIRGKRGMSFLQFALEGLESYHSSLGRFDFPDQYPLFSASAPSPIVTRTVSKPPIPRLAIATRDDLLAFYRELLPRLCRAGDDPNTYGETVYADSDLLIMLNERVNVGRYVAQVKADRDPSLFDDVENTNRLKARLKDAARENALLATVRGVAERYELDPGVAEDVFRWIIGETMLVELEYLRQVANHERSSR